MSRDIPALLENALDDSVINPFFAIELLFDGDEVLRLWTGVGILSYQSVDWFGTGQFLQIDTVEETSEIAAKGATITLSGVPSEVLSLALSEPYQGRQAKVYFGMHLDGEADTASMTEIFAGYMDQMNIEEAEGGSTVQLTIENKLIDLERPRTARFTNAYQKYLYPNDKGLEFVEDLQTKELFWGKAAP
jgi:hypothetical protein